MSPRILAIAGAVGAVAAPAGWLVTDRLEQRNDFCNACHLEPGVPLHAEIRRAFDGRPPSSLAAGHAAAGNEHRADGAYRPGDGENPRRHAPSRVRRCDLVG